MKKNPYVKAVAPLFNNGKLFALGIHRYWDVDYVPMRERYDYSLQSQFEQVKRDAGITADIAFCTDEMNFKTRKAIEDEAATGMLTALWDAVGVVGDKGQCVSQFVFPWKLVHTTDQPGTTRRLVGLPPMARKLGIHGGDGLFQPVPLAGQTTISIEGLREGETWMFLALK